MTENEIYQSIIDPSIKRARDEMPNFNFTSIGEKSPLYGVPGAMLDSLNLISFVFIVEEEFERATGKKLKISTQDVLNAEDPPFASLAALGKFLLRKNQ